MVLKSVESTDEIFKAITKPSKSLFPRSYLDKYFLYFLSDSSGDDKHSRYQIYFFTQFVHTVHMCICLSL